MLSGPDVSTSKPKRMWRIGEFRAFLYERPRAIAKTADLPVWIEYRWALAVFGKSRPTDPLTIVTAEIAMPSSGADGQFGRDDATCLCQFMPDYIHANLGSSSNWANEERFISAALDIARQFANTESAPVEIEIHGYRRTIVTSVAFASVILLAVLFQQQATNEPPGFGIADWLFLTFILYIATGTAILALTRAGHVVETTVADIHLDASRSVKPIATWKLRFATAVIWFGAILLWVVFLPSWTKDSNKR